MPKINAASTHTNRGQVDVPPNFYRGGRLTWHQRRRHALVRRLMAGLEGQRVLDYGCGYGDLTSAISKTNPVVGIDIDPARVAFARQQYLELEFHEFDGNAAPFPDGTFDVVLSCVVLPFVSNHRAHLRDIRRLLERGGHLIIVSRNYQILRNLARQAVGKPAMEDPLNRISALQLRSMLQQFGFNVVREDYFYDPPFDGTKNLKAVFLRSFEQVLAGLRVASLAPYFAFLANIGDE